MSNNSTDHNRFCPASIKGSCGASGRVIIVVAPRGRASALRHPRIKICGRVHDRAAELKEAWSAAEAAEFVQGTFGKTDVLGGLLDADVFQRHLLCLMMVPVVLLVYILITAKNSYYLSPSPGSSLASRKIATARSMVRSATSYFSARSIRTF